MAKAPARKAKKRLSGYELERQDLRAFRLSLRGWPLRRIAEDLGMASFSSAQNAVIRGRVKAQAAATEDAEAARVDAMQTFSDIREEAWMDLHSLDHGDKNRKGFQEVVMRATDSLASYAGVEPPKQTIKVEGVDEIMGNLMGLLDAVGAED